MANGELARIWKVTRFCCTSGQCVDCHLRARPWRFSMEERRARITHASGLTKPLAETMAKNWRSYEAKVEAM